jgi:putative ATP-dependent endonuclease of OLD family
MHISRLSLVNYRNFPNTKLLFKEGINTIIGENGSGKTNLFTAMRLLLDDNMLRYVNKLDETDFHRGLGDWRGHWIIVSLEFEKVSQDESIQALFLHANGNIREQFVEKATYNLIFRPKTEVRRRLSQLMHGDHAGLAALRKEITTDDYERIFTGRSEADFNDEALYKRVVGDFQKVVFSKELEAPEIGCPVPKILSLATEISFTHVKALRDVVSDFKNNRTNPLLTLLKGKSGEIDPTVFQPIAKQVQELNAAIARLDDVQNVQKDISSTIKDAAGETYAPTSLSIKSDLSDEAERLFQSLKLFVGEGEKGYEGTIDELSLGGANLIYLTLKLLEFKYQQKRGLFANFLLIEEPEAHIHTHIQKTLFDRIKYPDTQVIYSTHSTHISEVCNVRNMNILGRHAGRCEAFQPTAGLDAPEITNIQRYLDAVRSNLLFAKSVVLVEGDAEEILVPLLVKWVLGVSLDELGISLINIRSTGFQNVAVLFHETRIRKKCSIVTDLDASFVDTTPDPADAPEKAEFKKRCKGSQESGIARKRVLETFASGNPWLRLQFAPHTFEVDFVAAGNAEKVAGAVNDVYKDPKTISLAQSELKSPDIAQYGRRVLTMANYQGKGWFAILLGNKLDHRVIIPDYIIDAVFFGATITTELWFDILSYRLRLIAETGAFAPDAISRFQTYLDAFRMELLDIGFIADELKVAFPADALNRILERYRAHVLS